MRSLEGLAPRVSSHGDRGPWRALQEARAWCENHSVGAAAFATIFTGLRVRPPGVRCEGVRFVRKRRVVSHPTCAPTTSPRFACLPASYPPACWVGSGPVETQRAPRTDTSRRGAPRADKPRGSGESIHSFAPALPDYLPVRIDLLYSVDIIRAPLAPIFGVESCGDVWKVH